jgi:hypothetical protein
MIQEWEEIEGSAKIFEQHAIGMHRGCQPFSRGL